MIKVLYLCENLKIGGAEQLLLTTVKYLDRSKFLPVVYCIGEKGEIGQEMEQNNIMVVALNKKASLWNIPIVFNLRRIFRLEKPDILHTHLFYANYFGRIAAILARIPATIITEHGTYSNFKKFYHHFIDYILSFHTSKIIAVSKAVKGYLLRYTLISSRKISVVYNAVDFERFDTAYAGDRGFIRQKLGYSSEDLLIGCVSNLAPWKGQLSLLGAFLKVIKHFPFAKLIIIGRDSAGFKDKLVYFVKENSITDNVYFFGERRDIPEILKAIDIFVFPSLTEGLGISLLEAMYMGLPAVASATEGILEIIENNKDGVMVLAGDPEMLAEKIIMLLKDRQKMEEIGLNAREKIKLLFSPSSYIDNLETLYNNTVGAK